MVVCKPHVLWGTPATGASVLQCGQIAVIVPHRVDKKPYQCPTERTKSCQCPTERTNSSIGVPLSGHKAVSVPQSGQKALSVSHRAEKNSSISVPQSGQKAQGVSHRADKKLYQCPFAGSVTVPFSSFLNNTCRQDTSTIQKLTTVRLRAEPVKKTTL